VQRLEAFDDALAALSPEGQEQLHGMGRRVEFAAGQVLIRQGATDRTVHLLLAGRVKVSVVTRDGGSVLLALRGPGDTLGELSAIDGQPRSATVEAMDVVTALVLSAERFLGFLVERPSLLLALAHKLATRLRESDVRRIEMATATTDVRLARQLLHLLATHGRPVSRDERDEALQLRLSQQDLAASIGAARETVSLALGQLREAGALETHRGRVIVRDLAVLRDAATL